MKPCAGEKQGVSAMGLGAIGGAPTGLGECVSASDTLKIYYVQENNCL